MTVAGLEGEIAVVAALDEPVRRALYLYVAGRSGDVGRDQAARAVRVSRALAAFHLDKLVALGLLDTSYRRLSGRSGPGAGRPAKLYRRSARQVAVTLPQRRYDLLARLFAAALPDAPGRARAAVRQAARRFGERLGAEARRRAGPRATGPHLLRHCLSLLRTHGFAPYRVAGGEVRLGNCPFDALARDRPALVCGVTNAALMEGLVAGLRLTGVRAALDRQPGQCCVTLRLARRA